MQVPRKPVEEFSMPSPGDDQMDDYSIFDHPFLKNGTASVSRGEIVGNLYSESALLPDENGFYTHERLTSVGRVMRKELFDRDIVRGAPIISVEYSGKILSARDQTEELYERGLYSVIPGRAFIRLEALPVGVGEKLSDDIHIALYRITIETHNKVAVLEFQNDNYVHAKEFCRLLLEMIARHILEPYAGIREAVLTWNNLSDSRDDDKGKIVIKKELDTYA